MPCAPRREAHFSAMTITARATTPAPGTAARRTPACPTLASLCEGEREIAMLKLHLRMTLVVLSLLWFMVPAFAQPADPLRSWNDGAAKNAIVEFVRVTTD